VWLPGTMGYKYAPADLAAVEASLEAPNSLLKIIPDVDGTLRICELVVTRLEDIELKGAWVGPGALDLHAHALAPVAELPVLEVLSATHIFAYLTLGLGKVVHDRVAAGEQGYSRDRYGRTNAMVRSHFQIDW
jgi:acetoacetate decarboxylase